MSNKSSLEEGNNAEVSNDELVQQIFDQFSENVERVENEISLQGDPIMSVEEFGNFLAQLSPQEIIELEYLLILVFGLSGQEEEHLLDCEYTPEILASFKIPEVRAMFLAKTLNILEPETEVEPQDKDEYKSRANKWRKVIQFMSRNEG